VKTVRALTSGEVNFTKEYYDSAFYKKAKN